MVLIILDGFGERAETADNAVRMAKTPRLDALFATYPHGVIGTSGPDVGLPPGQMGNSEVGHLNFGAGRIAMMDISRIDNAVHDGTLGTNAVIAKALARAKEAGGRLHLLGLLSDGGVHSMITHLFALIDSSAKAGVQVVVHPFLDGRDVQPKTGPGYIERLQKHLEGKGTIGTVGGRYFGMDRDNRWERIERAFMAIVHGESPARFPTALEGTIVSIAAGKTDEFVEPFCVGEYAGVDSAKDVALHFNFRPDRTRELSRALTAPDFTSFDRKSGTAPFSTYVCMTMYDSSLGLPIAFPKEPFPDVFGDIVSRAGKTQFRCAETEKYAHVTYFFNGGREEPFTGEERKLVPSPKDVATYDLKPEMSARAVADEVVAAINKGTFDFVLCNFANPDMVGHTGVLGAAITAVESVDEGVGRIADAVLAQGGAMFVTADHGNCELMKDPGTGEPHTAHTLNPVPFLYVQAGREGAKIRTGGRICDVAPTMLDLMDLPVPSAMTGIKLIA